MATGPNQPRDGLSFGPFNLLAGERLLTKAGVPIELGARALDILIALTSTPNEVVSKKDLIARVWPDVVVEEGSLRFHMINLRKALGDGKDGARYIATLPGRGYCFVAPVVAGSQPARRGSRQIPARQSSPPLEPDGRPGRRRPQAVGSTRRIAHCQHRWCRRDRQNHGRDRGGASSERGLRWRRAVRRFRDVERSQSGGPRRCVDAGAGGRLRRRAARPDGLSARQANSADPRHVRASRRRGRHACGEHCRGGAAGPHPGHKSRGSAHRRGARLQAGCPGMSAGRPGDHGGGCSFVSGNAIVHGARGSERRQSGYRRCGRARCREHLPKARRRRAGAGIGGQTGRDLGPAADRRASRPASDAGVAGVAHGPATSKDPASHTRLELSAPQRAGTHGAAPAFGIRRAFYARCGARGHNKRDGGSFDGLRRDRQPCCEVHGGHAAHRGDDALPASGHDTRLRARNPD